MQLGKIAQWGLDEQVISEQEAQVLRQAEESRLRTINVDDFEPEELAAKPTSKLNMGNAA